MGHPSNWRPHSSYRDLEPEQGETTQTNWDYQGPVRPSVVLDSAPCPLLPAKILAARKTEQANLYVPSERPLFHVLSS